MRSMSAVLLALFVALGVLRPPCVRAQDSRGPPLEVASQSFVLEQNYPSPVSPETWIPFYLNEELFKNGEAPVVTVRIVNILRQLVAIPIAVDYPRGERPPMVDLQFTEPGRKLAYWNGENYDGEPVPSGVYYSQLTVGGQSQIRKMVVVQQRRRPRLIPWFPRPRKPSWLPWFRE